MKQIAKWIRNRDWEKNNYTCLLLKKTGLENVKLVSCPQKMTLQENADHDNMMAFALLKQLMRKKLQKFYLKGGMHERKFNNWQRRKLPETRSTINLPEWKWQTKKTHVMWILWNETFILRYLLPSSDFCQVIADAINDLVELACKTEGWKIAPLDSLKKCCIQ